MIAPVYHPKGEMCCGCEHGRNDCSSLPFVQMPPIKRDGDVVTVRCTSYLAKIAQEG